MMRFLIGLLLYASVVLADDVDINDLEFTPRSRDIHVLEGGDYIVGFSQHKSLRKCEAVTNSIEAITFDIYNSTTPLSGDAVATILEGNKNLYSYGAQGMCKIHVTNASLSEYEFWSVIAFDDSNIPLLMKIVDVIVHPKNSLKITPSTTDLDIEEGEDFRIGYLEHPAISKCYYQMENGEGDSFDLNYGTHTNQQIRGKTDFIFTHELSGLCQIYVTYPRNETILRFTITASNGQRNISSTNFTIRYYKKDSIVEKSSGLYPVGPQRPNSLPTNHSVVEVKNGSRLNLVCSSGGEPLSDCLLTSPLSENYYLKNEITGNFSYGTTWHKGECGIEIEETSPSDYGLWMCEYKIGFGSRQVASRTNILVKKV